MKVFSDLSQAYQTRNIQTRKMAHSHKEGGTEGFLGASFYELWELLCPLAYEWMLCVSLCVWPSTSDGCAVVDLQL